AGRRRSVVEAVESRTSLREGKTMAANNNGGKRMRASVGLLAACAGVLVAARAEAAGPKIGLSLPTQREERWVKDRQTMEAEAKKAGIELRVQVTDNDASKQVAQCENLISQGIKVLILAPHDASSASVIIDKTSKAGIKVISYDRLVTDSPLDYYYLSFDNVKVGELQGDFITKKVPKGVYIVLAGSPTDNNAKLFREGAMKYIKPLADKGDIKIVMDQFVKDWQPSEAQKLCEQSLTANQNKVDAVLAPNDGTAGGCIQALASQGLAGKVPITGQDAELSGAIRIVQGVQSMTIFKDTRALGKKAIEMAVDIAGGKSIDTGGKVVNNNRKDVPSVLLTPVIVTKENLDHVLILSGFYPYGTYTGDNVLDGQVQKFDRIRDSEHAGIAIIYQELALVKQMTIAENIFLGSELCMGKGVINWNETFQRTSKALKEVGLKLSPASRIIDPGRGSQQLVEIAKALT